MKIYTAIIEKCPDTGLYVGYIPGFPGAHSQESTREELMKSLKVTLKEALEFNRQAIAAAGREFGMVR